MKTDSAALDALRALRAERKFEARGFYPGAPTEETRVYCEAWVNSLIDSLSEGLPFNPNKDFVLSQFRAHLHRMQAQDTEEREAVCAYCERIMDALEIESSEGVLNRWLYGFDPNDEES